MANRWGNNGNSDIIYFLELQNHCSRWIQHEIKRHLLLGRVPGTQKVPNLILMPWIHLIRRITEVVGLETGRFGGRNPGFWKEWPVIRPESAITGLCYIRWGPRAIWASGSTDVKTGFKQCFFNRVLLETDGETSPCSLLLEINLGSCSDMRPLYLYHVTSSLFTLNIT